MQDWEQLKIYELIVNGDGSATPTGPNLYGTAFTSNPLPGSDNGFTIAFGASINKAYRVSYTTEKTDVNKTGEFKNNAKLTGTLPSGEGIGPGGSGHVEYDVTKTPTISNTISKSTPSINYSNKTITWRITIDPKKEPMKELKLIDTFEKGGLQLIPGTVIVKRGNDTLAKDVDYTLTPSSPDLKEGFVIDFNGGSSLHTVEEAIYTITYTTNFDRAWSTSASESYQLTSYVNKVVGQWYETTTTGLKTKNATATRTVTDRPAVNNGQKNGAIVLNGAGRTEREIDWSIDINYLSEEYTSFTLADAWNAAHQVLKSGSIQIYPYTINSAGNISVGSLISEGDYASLGIEVSGVSNGGFTIKFDDLSTPYRITYTTELIGQSQASYLNTAQITGEWKNGGTVEDTLTKTVDFSPQNTEEVFLTKAGSQVGTKSYIDWSIKFNSSLSYIEDAVVTDKLSSGHSYVYGSIAVSKKTPSGYVSVAPGINTYTVEMLSDPLTNVQSFVLTFHTPVNTEFEITYRTKISANAANGDNLSNEVSFTGLGVTTTNENTEDMVTIQKISSGGTATGEIGELTITKTDASLSNVKLAGAVFELMDSNHNVIYPSLVTGEDGTVTIAIDRSTYQTISSFYIKEISAPSGYILEDPDNSSNWTQVTYNPNEFNEVTITNQKLREIKIVKTGSDGLNLSGAKFNVTGPDGYSETVETLGDGTVTLSGLDFGTYTFIETAAPSGYQLDIEDNTWTVTLSETDTSVTPKVLNVMNQKLRTLEIHKTDGAGINSLSGAKFRITGPNGYTNEVTTGTDGKALISGLYFGTYTITEIQPPTGYQFMPGETVKIITLSETSDETTAVLVKNESLKSIRIIKKGEADENLRGATFEIRDSNGDLAGTIETGTDGTATLDGLEFGTYSITEITAPDGYQITASIPEVTISGVSPAVTEVTVINKVLRSLTIRKTDAANTAKTLSGAEFLITGPNGYSNTVSTGTDGTVTLTGLVFGTYTVKETKAPAGYNLNTSPYTVAVDDSSLVFTVDITNTVYVPVVIPTATPTPTPTVTPTPGEEENPKPTSTPTPTKPTEPTPSIAPTPTTPKEPVKEVTPEETPKGGNVEVTEGSKPSIGEKPKNGKVEIDKDGNWVYTPDAGFTGKDEFTIIITHPDGSTEEILVEITVDEVPLGTTSNNGEGVHIPKTGENNSGLANLAAVLGLVIGSVVFAGRIKFKKSRKLIK